MLDDLSGNESLLKEGNSFVDAAAKEGRTKHPRDMRAEEEVYKSFLLVYAQIDFFDILHIS